MPSRDSRSRIAEASPIPQERMTAEEIEAYEEDERNPIVVGGAEGKLAHELPPQSRPPSERLSYDNLLLMGLSDAEALLIVNTLRQKNGGLVEYDEDAEAERVAKLRMQQHQISRIDGGNTVQAQLSTMEAYFTGAIPRGDGQYCKRKRYMSPRDEKVWINGYHFNIPKHTPVHIPTEVIDMLGSTAQARGDFDVVSAAFQARQSDPIDMHTGVIPTPAEMSPRAMNYAIGDPFAR